MSPREVRRTNVWKLTTIILVHLFRSPPGTPPFWIDWLLSDWSPNLPMVPLRPEDLANGTAQEPESNRNMSVGWWCIRNSESYMLIQCYSNVTLSMTTKPIFTYLSYLILDRKVSNYPKPSILKCLCSFKSVSHNFIFRHVHQVCFQMIFKLLPFLVELKPKVL